MPRRVSETLKQIHRVKTDGGIGLEIEHSGSSEEGETSQQFLDKIATILKDFEVPATAVDTLTLKAQAKADLGSVKITIHPASATEENIGDPVYEGRAKNLTITRRIHIPGNFWGTPKGIDFVASSAIGCFAYNIGTLYMESDTPAETERANRELNRLRLELNRRNERLGLIYPAELEKTNHCQECGKKIQKSSRPDKKYCSHKCKSRHNMRQWRRPGI